MAGLVSAVGWQSWRQRQSEGGCPKGFQESPTGRRRCHRRAEQPAAWAPTVGGPSSFRIGGRQTGALAMRCDKSTEMSKGTLILSATVYQCIF